MPIQPPWPPADPQQPLPFDQRGACWPRGPCEYQNRLQIRYDVRAFWNSGIPNPAYDVWGDGQVLVPFANGYSPSHIQCDGKVRGAIFTTDSMTIVASDSSPTGWRIEVFAIISFFPAVHAIALANLPSDICFGTIIVNPTSVDGADPPDFFAITPVKWYETSQYPYYG